MAQHQDEPAKVDAAPGTVTEHKPDGSDVTMSPDVAVQIAQRLLDAAAVAKGEDLIRKHSGKSSPD